jgi:hypothetical protein
MFHFVHPIVMKIIAYRGGIHCIPTNNELDKRKHNDQHILLRKLKIEQHEHH